MGRGTTSYERCTCDVGVWLSNGRFSTKMWSLLGGPYYKAVPMIGGTKRGPIF